MAIPSEDVIKKMGALVKEMEVSLSKYLQFTIYKINLGGQSKSLKSTSRLLDVGSDVGSDVGTDVGSDVRSDVRSDVGSDVGSDVLSDV